MHEYEHVTPTPGSIDVIIAAAGSGSRFGDSQNKLFATLAGRPLWIHTVARLSARAEVGRIVMAVSQSDANLFQNEWSEELKQYRVELVLGGAERSDSVQAALECLEQSESADWIAVHDAARPLVRDVDLSAVFATAWQNEAAILVSPVTATMKRDVGSMNRSVTVPRRDLYTALTPQVFRAGLLKEAYRKHNGRPATDDAELVERTGHDVALVVGAADNLKITYPEDLILAEAILARQSHHA